MAMSQAKRRFLMSFWVIFIFSKTIFGTYTAPIWMKFYMEVVNGMKYLQLKIFFKSVNFEVGNDILSFK